MNIINSIFEEEEEESFPWDEDALKDFKKMISDKGIQCCTEDIFLLGFLRVTEFDVVKSLEILKNYHDVRLKYPEFFKNLLPSKLEEAMSLNVMQFLPKPDQKGRFMYFYEYEKWNTYSVTISDMYRLTMLVMDLQLLLHRTQVNGIIAIINTEGMSFSHFLQSSPRILNAVMNILFKDAYQMGYSELHYVNINARIKSLLRVLMSIFPRKLKEMIHFHSEMNTLHEFVSPECLPAKYGGTLPNIDPTESNNMIKANEEFYRKNEEYLQLYEEGKARNFRKRSHCQ